MFSIQAVGQEETPSLTFQLPFESTIIPGTEPILTGTCSTTFPLPSPLEIWMLTTPTSPAIESSGGYTVMLNEPVLPGSTVGPDVGKLTFQPSPAFTKYGSAGAFPICSTVS